MDELTVGAFLGASSASKCDNDGADQELLWGPSLRQCTGIVGHSIVGWRAGAIHQMFEEKDRSLVRTMLLVAERIRRAHICRERRELLPTPEAAAPRTCGDSSTPGPPNSNVADMGNGDAMNGNANVARGNGNGACGNGNGACGNGNGAGPKQHFFRRHSAPELWDQRESGITWHIPVLPSEIWDMIIGLLPITPTAFEATVVAGSSAHSFLDGIGVAACFNHPSGITMSASGDVLVCDSTNHRIRKFNPRTGLVSTLAGCGEAGHRDGAATEAMFHHPKGICCRAEDGMIIVTDHDTCCIRAVHPVTGFVTTLSGREVDCPTQFRRPTGVAAGVNGELIVADYFNNRVCRLQRDGSVRCIVGGAVHEMVGHRNGDGATSKWRWPMDVDVDVHGHMIVADSRNHVVRLVRRFAYDGIEGDYFVASDIAPEASALLFGERGRPRGVALDGAGNIVVSDVVHNFVAIIHAATGKVQPLAGDKAHFRWDPRHATLTAMAQANFSRPRGVAVDAHGNVYVADSHRITKIHASTYAFKST